MHWWLKKQWFLDTSGQNILYNTVSCAQFQFRAIQLSKSLLLLLIVAYES